jgi:hypothetical protein
MEGLGALPHGLYFFGNPISAILSVSTEKVE